MSTLREDFEAFMRDGYFGGIADAGPWDEARNCYVELPTHMAWKGYQAATERAAKMAADLAYDAAIKYANGREVDFEQEVGDAIRGAK
jgi:hypothetical protein